MPATLVNDGARVTALDGLRAVAVFLVIVQHCVFTQAGNWTPGPIGVRIFFVLSGFLITGILVAAREQAAAAGAARVEVWRAFLLRRGLRILPLAYAAMGAAWLVGAPAMTERGWWHLAYLGNIDMAFSGERAHEGLAHFWSLAVEEHFYMVWPLVILAAPTRTRRQVVVAVIGLAAVLRGLTAETVGLWGAYVLTWSRMDALAFGALLAVTPIHIGDLLMAGAGLSVLSAQPMLGEPLRFTLNESGAVMYSGALVLAVSRGWGASLLGCRPMVYLGSISYGLYVWSGLLPFALRALERHTGLPLLPGAHGLSQLVVASAWSVALASVSWYLFERPINGLKRQFPYVRTRPRALGSVGREMIRPQPGPA